MLIPTSFPKGKPYESQHSLIRYGYRSPQSGLGWEHGITGEDVAQEYGKGLDAACKHLASIGWPSVDHKIKTYLFCTKDRNKEHCFGYALGPNLGDPHLGLASISYEVDPELARMQRLATALHEAVHYHQFHSNETCENNELWYWWNEATATGIEALYYPTQVDRLRYLEPWINSPHRHPSYGSGYEAFPLATYLSNKLGAKALANTYLGKWQHPFEAITAVVDAMGDKPFAHPLEDDYFLDYCREAYFLDGEPVWQSQVKRLLGQRLVTYAFDEYPSSFDANRSWINQLGCRYFRLFKPKLRLVVTITCEAMQDFEHVKAGLYSVDMNGNYLGVEHEPERDTTQLQIAFRPEKTGATDHYVLIMANTSYGRGAHNQLRFKIDTEAED